MMRVEVDTSAPSTAKPAPLGNPGRGYLVLAVGVLAALAIATGAGFLGILTLGRLDTVMALALTGAGVLILAVATTILLFGLRRTFHQVAEHEARWNRYQDERAEMAQHIQEQRDARQDEVARTTETALRAHDKRIEGRLDAVVRAQADKLAATLREERARFEAMIGRQEDQFARMLARHEEALEEQATRAALAAEVLNGPPLTHAADTSAEPFGLIYPVAELRGVTNDQVTALARAGIADTRQLWRARPEEVSELLGLSRRAVRALQAQCELVAVNGINPPAAALLNLSGVESVAELAHADAIDLHNRTIKARMDRHDLRGISADQQRIDAWIHAARAHDPAASLRQL